MKNRKKTRLEEFALGEINGGYVVYDRILHGINLNYDEFDDVAVHKVGWQLPFRQHEGIWLRCENNEWLHKGNNYPEGNCFDFIAQISMIDITNEYDIVFGITMDYAGLNANDVRQFFMSETLQLQKLLKSY